MCAVDWEQFLVRTNRNVTLLIGTGAHIASQLYSCHNHNRSTVQKTSRNTNPRGHVNNIIYLYTLLLYKREKAHTMVTIERTPRALRSYQNKRIIIVTLSILN